jgi:hypothetical protein
LLLLTLYVVVAPLWFRYALFAAWVCATAVIVRSSTAGRSAAFKASAVLLGTAFVAFVVVAQRSETGSEVVLALATALGLGLIASFVRNHMVHAGLGRRA